MSFLMKRYGKTALVTGASAGIGAAFAEYLASEGLNLVLVARREKRLQQLKQELEAKYPVSVLIIVQDLSLHDAADRVCEQLQDAQCTVSILINNAGFGSCGKFPELNLEQELAMVDLHCRLPVALTHKLLPGMQKDNKGAVIMLSSVLGQIPTPYMTTYAATKAFDLFFAEGLYEEFRGTGIDVIAVSPGYTRTEFQGVAGKNQKTPVPVAEPLDVVKATFEALGKRPSVIEGIINKLITGGTFLMPKPWVLQVSGNLAKPRSH